MSKALATIRNVAIAVGVLLAYWLGQQAFYVANYTFLFYAVSHLVSYALMFPSSLTFTESFVLGAALYSTVKCATIAVKAVVRSLECR
jgi:hypothetical protein